MPATLTATRALCNESSRKRSGKLSESYSKVLTLAVDSNGRINLFSGFTLDVVRGCVVRSGESVHLRPQTYEVLKYLAENRGRLISKDKLIEEVWKGRAVTDGSLGKCIEELREALGPESKEFIRNVRGRGYIFDTGVEEWKAGETISARSEQIDVVRVTVEDHEELPNLAVPEALPAPRPVNKFRTAVVAAAAVLILITTALVGYRLFINTHTGSATPINSIAVLPFKNESGNGELEYLSDGMTESLINDLSRFTHLSVKARSSVFHYRGQEIEPQKVASELSVQAILSGRVVQRGNTLTLYLSLVDGRNGNQIWGERYDRKPENLLALQKEIARDVSEKLRLQLTTAEQQRSITQGTENTEAYQAYLKGRYFWNKRNVEGYNKAVEYFNQAIEHDPAYALAYSGLADAIMYRGGHSLIEVNQAHAKSRAALKKAIEIDETLAEPRATLGLLAMNVDWDWAEAERQYKRAVELNPNYATAHHWYGEFLAYMGRFDEGLAEIKRAQELDPLSLIINTDVGKVYFLARQYERAIEQCKKTLEMDPNYGMARVWLGFSYSLTGRHEEAVAEFHRVKGVEDDPMWLSYLGYVYARAGREEEAKKIMKRLTALSKQTYVSPSSMLIVYMGLDEKDQVFKWFNRVLAEHSVGMIELRVNPGFDSLRSDPRYEDLMRRAGFPS